MKKTELPCGIVEDLLPSYVDGLTGEESSEAVREHLGGCETCRKKYEAMKAAEAEAVRVDAPVVDYMGEMNRRMMRWIALAVVGTVVLVVLAVFLRTYIIGVPVKDYELDWTVRDYGGYVMVEVGPSDQDMRIIDWNLEENWDTGAVVYKITGRKVRKSPLHSSLGYYGHGTPSENLHEFYVGNTLVWADGLTISKESRKLYDARTPYVGDAPALNVVASVLIYDEIGMFDNELQTAAEPYGWTLRFENCTPGGSMLNKQSIALMNLNMQTKAAQILAVVGNLGYVSWSYTDESDTLHTQTVTLEEVNALLPELVELYNSIYGTDWTARDSVKDYADSPAGLEQLRRLLEMAH